MTTAFLKPVEGETKVCDWMGYQTQDLWFLSQMHYDCAT